MELFAADAAPLLIAAGLQSQVVMPFVLLGVVAVLVVLLLVVFGRHRRHRNQHSDHEE